MTTGVRLGQGLQAGFHGTRRRIGLGRCSLRSSQLTEMDRRCALINSRFDLIIASAGATHPLSSWLDSLKLGGRLLFPMTATRRGGMLLVTRETEDSFAARFLCKVGFIDFRGARDPGMSRRLAAALGQDWGRAVQSLRRDYHAQGRTCWLHSEGWCLSRRLPADTRPATP
jgi:hypothetical protein